ncbi:MAG: hypothetical protein VKP72_13610 [bacterium]|nr:hypothetical protein [bacterium]
MRDPDLLQEQSLLGDLEKGQIGFRRRVAKRRRMPGLQPLGAGEPGYRDSLCLVYRADAQKTTGAETLLEAIRRSVK